MLHLLRFSQCRGLRLRVRDRFFFFSLSIVSLAVIYANIKKLFL